MADAENRPNALELASHQFLQYDVADLGQRDFLDSTAILKLKKVGMSVKKRIGAS